MQNWQVYFNYHSTIILIILFIIKYACAHSYKLHLHRNNYSADSPCQSLFFIILNSTFYSFNVFFVCTKTKKNEAEECWTEYLVLQCLAFNFRICWTLISFCDSWSDPPSQRKTQETIIYPISSRPYNLLNFSLSAWCRS